jgi:hypothetical protein
MEVDNEKSLAAQIRNLSNSGPEDMLDDNQEKSGERIHSKVLKHQTMIILLDQRMTFNP